MAMLSYALAEERRKMILVKAKPSTEELVNKLTIRRGNRNGKII